MSTAQILTIAAVANLLLIVGLSLATAIVKVRRERRQTAREVDLGLLRPVLFLTAKAQESDVQRGFAAGGNDYVVKPFSPRELSTRIDALLSRVPR